MTNPYIYPHEGWRDENEELPGMPMVLPPDGSPGITNSPPSGVDLHTGLMASRRVAILASRLNWSVSGSANSHPLIYIQYRGRDVPVDEALGPALIQLWDSGYISLAACQGDSDSVGGDALGYVMFSEVVGKAFMEFALRNERWLSPGFVQRFEWILQPNDWYDFMSKTYPLLEPVYPDSQGRVFTVCWRFAHADLATNGPRLIELLKTETARQDAA